MSDILKWFILFCQRSKKMIDQGVQLFGNTIEAITMGTNIILFLLYKRAQRFMLDAGKQV